MLVATPRKQTTDSKHYLMCSFKHFNYKLAPFLPHTKRMNILQAAGTHTFVWNGSKLFYFFQLCRLMRHERQLLLLGNKLQKTITILCVLSNISKLAPFFPYPKGEHIASHRHPYMCLKLNYFISFHCAG